MICPLNIFTLNKTFDSFLDYHWRWLKSKKWRNKNCSMQYRFLSFDCSLFSWHYKTMFYLLFSWSTTSATSWLWFNCFLLFIIRTIHASISCFLSSSTFRFVSFRSGSVSPWRALACWILTRWRFEVNASLTLRMNIINQTRA